jgi:hypothetical protein
MSTSPTVTVLEYVTHLLSQVDILRDWPITLFPILASYYNSPSYLPALYLFPSSPNSIAVVPFVYPSMAINDSISQAQSQRSSSGVQWYSSAAPKSYPKFLTQPGYG